MFRQVEFRKLEQQLAEQLAELEALKGSTELQKEIASETKLRNLLAEYGFSLKDVISVLDPQGQPPRRSSCNGQNTSSSASNQAVQKTAYWRGDRDQRW